MSSTLTTSEDEERRGADGGGSGRAAAATSARVAICRADSWVGSSICGPSLGGVGVGVSKRGGEPSGEMGGAESDGASDGSGPGRIQSDGVVAGMLSNQRGSRVSPHLVFLGRGLGMRSALPWVASGEAVVMGELRRAG